MPIPSNSPIFFDCNVTYGPRPNLSRHQRWSLDHLLADMEHYGIAGALVRHEQALRHDPRSQNLRLIEEIMPNRDRLFPCWVVAPNVADDLPDPEAWGEMLAAHDVRAVQLLPDTHRYPVAPEILAPLADMLAVRRNLILVEWRSFSDPYREIKTLCKIFARNPVLLLDVHWTNYRPVTALLAACPNLYLELSAFQANRVVELFGDRFGPERLLFGSGFPAHSGGAARAYADWSLASPETAAAFAGGNVARLLDIPLGNLPDVPASEEPIQAAARRGAAMTELVIDAHCHVLDDDETCSGGDVMRHGDAAGQREMAARCGIDLTAMMSWQGPCCADPDAGNALLAKLVPRHPEAIIGLTSVDPLQQTEEEMLAALEAHAGLAFAGIKPYFPSNRVHYHDPRYDAVWWYANEHRLYTLLHTNQTPQAVDGVIEIARRYPEATFILPHVGGCWDYAELCAAAARQAPNIFCELTLTPVLNGVVEYLAEHAGRDRVLFGSDAPMRDPRPQLGWVVHSRLPTDAKRDVLGRNYLSILERCRTPGMNAIAPRLAELRALTDRLVFGLNHGQSSRFEPAFVQGEGVQAEPAGRQPDSGLISYRLAERQGRKVIEASNGKVIPWLSYTNSMDVDKDHWLDKHDVFLDAGVDLYHLNLRYFWNHDSGKHWDNPFFSVDGKPMDEPRGPMSWHEQAPLLLERNPEALFFMRFGIMTQSEWRKNNLDQFQSLPAGTGAANDGCSILGSLASDLYLERTVQMIRDAVRWCEKQPWRNRIVGYSVFPYGEGSTENALFGGMFDDSPVMNQAFRGFLREKYQTDAGLRQAWADLNITFETAAVPTLEEWLRKKKERDLMHWPEPRLVRRERDYFELQKQLFHRFWNRVFDTMLEATAARPVIKGYDILKQQMQGWLHDADFEAKWGPDTLDTYAHILLASGSVGAAPLLDHPGLDLLQTPGMYYNRAMGYAWDAEALSDSLLLRGKLNFMEADMRTWVRKSWRGIALAPEQQIPDAGVFMTPDEMRAGFNRTHAWALTRNQMYYFCSVCGANWWYHEPPIAEHVADLVKTPSWSDEIPWSNTRDAICLVVDDESAMHEDFSSGFQYLAVYRQLEEGLALSGVPYRIHLLSDLERDNFPEYRTYLFPNLFKIDADTEALLRRKVLRNGNVAIFGPGTGITDGETLSATAASRIFGVEMELLPKRVARRMILQNHGHPISARLDTVTFGDTYSYGPLLVPAAQRLASMPDKAVADGLSVPVRVTPLSAGFYHYFLDRPGAFAADFGRGGSGSGAPGNRGQNDYAVVFVPTVPMPPAFLRECARYAGSHVWSERNAVVYAAADLVALHVGGAGEYELRLPQPAIVTDLFTGRIAAEKLATIKVKAAGPLTKIFKLRQLEFANVPQLTDPGRTAD